MCADDSWFRLSRQAAACRRPSRTFSLLIRLYVDISLRGFFLLLLLFIRYGFESDVLYRALRNGDCFFPSLTAAMKLVA